MTVSAIILAAGKGTRMNAQQNKVYMPLGGHSVLSYSLRAFDQVKSIGQIIVVYAPGEELQLQNCLKRNHLNTRVLTVAGGKLRQDSVRQGLSKVASDTQYIAIHDGARPLITAKFIQQLLAKAFETGAVIPALPVKDTIKQVEDNVVLKTLPRNKLYRIQTPQIFNLNLYQKYQNCGDQVTDDASLIEKDYPVSVQPGSSYNLKITTPEDLWFAEAVIRKVEDFKW